MASGSRYSAVLLPGRRRANEERAQETSLEVFQQLQAGDLLFIDSTHTVVPGSEVNRMILEVLPQLPADVWVHFHDITFPYDYGPDLLAGALFFWRETSLLHAFLAMNNRYRIVVSLSMLHYGMPEALRPLFPNYRPAAHDEGLQTGDGHFPSAIYLKS